MSRTDNEPALIATERKPYRRLSTRGIQREIKIIIESAGLQRSASVHTLRYSMATSMLNNGAEPSAVQKLLGHSNPATTQIYAQTSPERNREQHKRYLAQ